MTPLPEGSLELLANLDGAILPLADVRISALDRGFLFGDGVYEVLRVYQGRPWLEKEHFARLANGLRAVRIDDIDLNLLRRRMHVTIAAGPFLEATVYIQITRGSAPRMHIFPEASAALEFLVVQDFVDPYRELRDGGAEVITQPDLRWRRCDIKSINLHANVLAAQTAQEAGCKEALLYLPDGTLTEGTHSSLFGIIGDTLVAPPNSSAILPGMTREFVVALAAKEGIHFREQSVKRQDLDRVSELLLTGTTTEVLPVVRVDRKPIGDGRPGPVTRKLQKAYRKAVVEFLAAPQLAPISR
jgi:D-alanine transaminase